MLSNSFQIEGPTESRHIELGSFFKNYYIIVIQNLIQFRGR